MFASHESIPAKPKTPALSQKTVTGVTPISDAAGLQNKIGERAYQLYDARGCEPGKGKEDWLQARA
jgi:Protein of unknown function (DUF2934)